jgi:hypothetical protein
VRLKSTVELGAGGGGEQMARESPVAETENSAGKRGIRRMTGSCRWTIDTSYRLLPCGSRWRKLAVVAFCLVLILCARIVNKASLNTNFMSSF